MMIGGPHPKNLDSVVNRYDKKRKRSNQKITKKKIENVVHEIALEPEHKDDWKRPGDELNHEFENTRYPDFINKCRNRMDFAFCTHDSLNEYGEHYYEDELHGQPSTEIYCKKCGEILLSKFINLEKDLQSSVDKDYYRYNNCSCGLCNFLSIKETRSRGRLSYDIPYSADEVLNAFGISPMDVKDGLFNLNYVPLLKEYLKRRKRGLTEYLESLELLSIPKKRREIRIVLECLDDTVNSTSTYIYDCILPIIRGISAFTRFSHGKNKVYEQYYEPKTPIKKELPGWGKRCEKWEIKKMDIPDGIGEKHYLCPDHPENHKTIQIVNCHDPKCPRCYPAWAWRRARIIEEKMIQAKMLYAQAGEMLYDPNHFALSPPQDRAVKMIETKEGEQALWKEAEYVLGLMGLRGGVVIYHSHRMKHIDGSGCENVYQCKKENPGKRHIKYESPHYHPIAYGRAIKSNLVEGATGWVYKKIYEKNKERSVKFTAQYLLSHCGLTYAKDNPNGARISKVIRYFGILKSNKIKKDYKLPPVEVIERCPECNEPLREHYRDTKNERWKPCEDIYTVHWDGCEGLEPPYLRRKVKIQIYSLHWSRPNSNVCKYINLDDDNIEKLKKLILGDDYG